jgi:hypothetical protein
MTRTRLPFTTILIAVAIANFATLVITYLLRAPVHWTVPIYLVCAVGGWLLAKRVQWRRLSIKIDRISVGLAVITLILLTIPRLSYVAEWIPGNNVFIIGDDVGRLGQMASMTLSDAYPLRHQCNANYLLSYYYAALYPWAVFKLLVPWVTLKDTIFLGNLFYHVLILGSFVELAHLLMRNTASVRILMFLVTLFGGLDWTLAGSLLTDCELWQCWLFHGFTQVTSFFVAQLIVIQHFVSFYALLVAYVVFFHSRIAGGHRLKALIVLLLCAAAFYTSPFPPLSAPFLAAIHYRVILRRLVLTWAMPIVALASLIPLSLFMGRLSDQGPCACTFRVAATGNYLVDRLLGAPVFFLLVPIIEFGGVPLVLFFIFRRLGRTMRAYLLGSTAFYALTFFVAFKSSDNLQWRGMFLPTFTVYAIFAYYYGRHYQAVLASRFRRTLQVTITLMAIAGTLGFLQVVAFQWGIAMYYSSLPYRFLRFDPPPRIQVLQRIRSRELARDRSVTHFQYRPEYGNREFLYCTEKLLDGVELRDMDRWEREELRMPKRGLFW